MPQVVLKECPKVYILETHRSKTPDSTLDFVKTIRDTVSMLDFRNATSVDRIGIPFSPATASVRTIRGPATRERASPRSRPRCP